MSKKNQQKIQIKGEIMFLILSITVLAFTVVFSYFYIMPAIKNNIREARITTIFNSIDLDHNYFLEHESIFGTKKLIAGTTDKSLPSSREYVRGANVDITATEVQKVINRTGFVLTNMPDADSIVKKYTYESRDNEYIFVTISSKHRDDVINNKHHMNIPLSDEDLTIDPNTGPSLVVIKVNIDNKNE